MNIGHRIYYFVSPDDVGTMPDGYEVPIYSTEAYSDGEARIVLGEFLHVTATRLIDVTEYD